MAEPLPAQSRPERGTASRAEAPEPESPSRRTEIEELQRKIAAMQVELGEVQPPEPAPLPRTLRAPRATQAVTQAKSRGAHRFQMRNAEPALRESTQPREFRAWDEPLPEPPPPFVKRIPKWVLWTFCLLFSAQFLAAGYYTARFLAQRPPEPALSTSPAEWTGPLTAELNQVLAAFQQGREPEGRQAAATLVAKAPNLPGIALLEAESARLQARFASVDIKLVHEQKLGGSFVYRASLERARNFSAQNKLNEAREALREAVQVDPTQTAAHYYLGEIWRRSGRFSEALLSFDRAAHRSRFGNQPDLALIRLHRQFAEVESGRESVVAAECEAALARPAPAPEWLALDAAIKLLAGHQAEARASLQRLRAMCPPNRLAALLDDHIFRSLLTRNELRDLLPKRDRAGGYEPFLSP